MSPPRYCCGAQVPGQTKRPSTCAPQQYVGGLIDRLGEHSHRLTQQLKVSKHEGAHGDE